MQTNTIFIGATNYERYCVEGRKAMLDKGYTLIENKKSGPYTAEELKAIGEDITGVISGCEEWNEDTLSAAPNLKVIVKFGVGVDNIDLEAAKRHGVQVANCPGMNAISVAEHTMSMLFGCMREVPALDKSVREGAWERRVFPEIFGSTFGVLGFGAIGQAVAARARAFGANVLVYNRTPRYEDAEKLGVKLCPLEEVLEKSDIITVHLPAVPATKHFINAESISKMKDGVIIVNTARGALANEEDVAAALRSGKIGAYGSDVYETEPMGGKSPLAFCANSVLSPHLAGESLNSYRNIGLATAKGMIAVHEGQELPHRLA